MIINLKDAKVKLIQKAETYQVQKRLFRCPICGHHDSGFSYGHLIADAKNEPKDFGPWYCESCGQGVFGHVTKDGQVFLKIDPDVKFHSFLHYCAMKTYLLLLKVAPLLKKSITL